MLILDFNRYGTSDGAIRASPEVCTSGLDKDLLGNRKDLK